MPTAPTNNNKPKSKRWIIFTIILLLFSFCFYEKSYFIAAYETLFPVKWSKGDKIYASENFLSAPILDIPVERLIRPMTLIEIDNLNIETSKKIELKRKFNPSAGLKVIQTKDGIFMKLLWKYKTAVVGNYIRTVILENKKSVFEIKPNTRLIETKYNPDDVPENYVIADTNAYIFPYHVAHSDPSLF